MRPPSAALRPTPLDSRPDVFNFILPLRLAGWYRAMLRDSLDARRCRGRRVSPGASPARATLFCARRPVGRRRLRQLAVCDSVATYSLARRPVHPLRQVLAASHRSQSDHLKISVLSGSQTLQNGGLRHPGACGGAEPPVGAGPLAAIEVRSMMRYNMTFLPRGTPNFSRQ